MERYIDLLNKCGVKTFFVEERETESRELFFIKKKLDMKRVKKVDSANIAVYVDVEDANGKFRGRSDVLVSSVMTDEEIIEKIKSAEFAAKFAKNPFYELPKGIKSDKVVMESDLNEKSLSDIAVIFADAFYEEDKDEESFVNSFELFVSEDNVHMVSSFGTDVAYSKRKVWGEFVAQCKEPQDVETYKSFEYDSMELDDLRELVKSTLKMTKDRANATKMPASGNYDIVLSDAYVAEVINFYGERALAPYIFAGYSDFKLGESVQGKDVKGDKLNIRFGVSVPFNEEGIAMSEREFINDGVLKTVHGGQRFAYYLGMEPIGTYYKGIIPAGKVSMKELINRPCLHVVNFSDFQMDALSGYFAGEIRLAYLYDGKGNVEIVTGGSVNGSILEAQKDLTFSSEMQKSSKFAGPKACLFKNIAVAGE